MMNLGIELDAEEIQVIFTRLSFYDVQDLKTSNKFSYLRDSGLGLGYKDCNHLLYSVLTPSPLFSGKCNKKTKKNIRLLKCNIKPF